MQVKASKMPLALGATKSLGKSRGTSNPVVFQAILDETQTELFIVSGVESDDDESDDERSGLFTLLLHKLYHEVTQTINFTVWGPILQTYPMISTANQISTL